MLWPCYPGFEFGGEEQMSMSMAEPVPRRVRKSRLGQPFLEKLRQAETWGGSKTCSGARFTQVCRVARLATMQHGMVMNVTHDHV